MSRDHDALSCAFEHARAHLDALDTAPVASRASPDELRTALDRALPEQGTPARQVIDQLVADTAGGLLGSQGGRFFAWVIGGGLPSAMAADWLTTVWDQNAGIHACSPAAAVTEEVAGRWLKELFGLPDESSFAFVTGSQMAHVTCLAAARHAMLAAHGWDVDRQGLFGAPRIRVLASADRHVSVDRAVRLLGMGGELIESLAVDASGRVTPEALSAALDRGGGGPTIVVLQAGELNAAAFDPFAQLAPIAHAAGAWVHVDGAFGLWARLSPRHRDVVNGIELCDSWTADGHKFLNIPYDSGFAFVRDAAAHHAAMTLSASYLPSGGGRDPIDWNPEFSRRARAFPVYAAIRELGREGIADMITRTCRHAVELAARIGELPGAELVAAPSFNQGLVRFLSPLSGANDADHDRRTDAVIAAVNRSGEAMFGGVLWRGRRVMRISVCNWRTSDADVDRAVAAVAAALAG